MVTNARRGRSITHSKTYPKGWQKVKVSKVKEMLSAYSDDEELMIAWNDKENYEYILEKPLPVEIWEKAVEKFDFIDLQDFNDECHYLVVLAKDELEEK